MNIRAPIIVIGPGRSGSTLLTRVLAAHPQIDFKGESDFLLPRLWLEAWENRFWLNWPRQASMNPTSASERLPTLSDRQRQLERARVGKLVAELLVQIFRVDARHARVWGYKEPWNGSSSFRYGWEPYDVVLPGACWVHLVRHPFAFARSNAQWDEAPWTLPYLRARLNDWKTMVEHNRLRAHTGRFCEIRFEDLTRDVRGTLSSVLRLAGLRWHTACAKAGAVRVMASQPGQGVELSIQLAARDLEKIIEEIDGLGSLMTELNYAVPKTLALRAAGDGGPPHRGTSADLRNPEGDWSEQSPPRFVLDRHLREVEEGLRRVRGELAESEMRLTVCQSQLTGAEQQLAVSQVREADREAQFVTCQTRLADAATQLAGSQAREAERAAQLTACQSQLAAIQLRLGASLAREAERAAQLTECQNQLAATQAQLDASQAREAERAVQLTECQNQLAAIQAQLDASQAREAEHAAQLTECREQLTATAAHLAEYRRLLERVPNPQRAVAERLTAFPRLTKLLARALRASADS